MWMFHCTYQRSTNGFVFLKVEVERMRARAKDKLMTQLASARHNADEKRAAAELKRNRAAARTAEQA